MGAGPPAAHPAHERSGVLIATAVAQRARASSSTILNDLRRAAPSPRGSCHRRSSSGQRVPGSAGDGHRAEGRHHDAHLRGGPRAFADGHWWILRRTERRSLGRGLRAARPNDDLSRALPDAFPSSRSSRSRPSSPRCRTRCIAALAVTRARRRSRCCSRRVANETVRALVSRAIWVFPLVEGRLLTVRRSGGS